MKTPRKSHVAKPEHAVTFAPFDAAEYLDSEEMIAAYLSEAAASGDEQMFMTALGDIARARSMTKLARESGLGRESLYKSLRPGAKPRFDTVSAIMRAMGLQLSVVPAKSASASIAGTPKLLRAPKTSAGTKGARPSRTRTSVGRADPAVPRAKLGG